jgi:hypothetical protein
VLIVSTMRAPEINAMLEDGCGWLRDYVPGTTPPEGRSTSGRGRTDGRGRIRPAVQ